MLDINMPHGPQQVDDAAEFIHARIRTLPRVAIFTGTGLGDMSSRLHIQHAIDYAAIPHFPMSTVETHAGRLVSGDLTGCPVTLMQGRFHLYEGYSPKAVIFPIRVLQMLGVDTLILTNAAGGLNSTYSAGDVMIITDHINLTGSNPLVGPNFDQWGPRFPDMTIAYSDRLRKLAQGCAKASGIPVKSGVYAGLQGPSLETPAEMKFLRTVGADAVGFSTVMETIAAVHGGMQVLGLSIITNLCCPESPIKADVAQIIRVAQTAAPLLISLIQKVLSHGEADDS